MDPKYEAIMNQAILFAEENGVKLDFSVQSLDAVDYILECYHKNLDKYQGKEDELWNVAIHFGIYIGETMLRSILKEKGYEWDFEGELPILRNQQDMELYPVTKAHKRILNGLEDSITGFYMVVTAMLEEDSPENPINEILDEEKMRPIKMSLSSGKSVDDAPYLEVLSNLENLEAGKEDFMILDSSDGFLQFYGYQNRYVAELQINLPNDDFRSYMLIDPLKKDSCQEVHIATTFGEFIPEEQNTISLHQLKCAIREYYLEESVEDFLEAIACADTTEETKEFRRSYRQ